METLNIIFNCLLGATFIFGLIFVVLLCIRNDKLSKVKNAEDLKEVNRFDEKYVRICAIIPTLLFSALLVVGPLMFYPEFCTEQLIGFILSGLWLLFGLFGIHFTKKEKN